MNLTGINTFLAIVETGSLVRASERLNVTQSTVTARLKGLEDELGQTLLYRQKSGTELTSHGFRFRRYAEAMADLWRQARAETALPEGAGAVFNLGCHIDLWPEIGRQMIDELERGDPATVISAWPGNQVHLEQWMTSGLIDAALTYRITTHEGQTMHALNSEQLMLYSTSAEAPDGADPGYIYVDGGGELGRRYMSAYSGAAFARVSFGSAVWALDYLQERGGSAYLPEHLVSQHKLAAKLHIVADAPAFKRPRYLITNDKAAENWPWLADLVKRLSTAM